MKVIGLVESPIKGPKGNKEFLIYSENYKNPISTFKSNETIPGPWAASNNTSIPLD